LFNVNDCDAKAFERLKFFVEHDPWKMKALHEKFFAEMHKAIKQRSAKKA